MLHIKTTLQVIFLLHIWIFTSGKQLNYKLNYQNKHQDTEEMHNYAMAW